MPPYISKLGQKKPLRFAISAMVSYFVFGAMIIRTGKRLGGYKKLGIYSTTGLNL